jgi:hypothetical protein
MRKCRRALLLGAVVPAAVLLPRTASSGSAADDLIGDHVHLFGGQATKDAFHNWLAQWRDGYRENDVSQTGIPEVADEALPQALRGRKAKVLWSGGGAASGVVTEGIGYALMVEGFEAARGSQEAVDNGLALTRAWLGMVAGPTDVPHPLGGGTNLDAPSSALKVDNWPYGVSAIEGPPNSKVASGVAAWKYPFDQCDGGCIGSASDADEDAALGMVYLAGALGYPEDFVDVAMRAVIAFASADMGFPDVYRTLPDGTRVFVVKGGSMWGGLLPSGGKYKAAQEPWCYSPGYFAPGHYRTFRDFVAKHWKPAFNTYLPPHVTSFGVSRPSTAAELRSAFDGAIVAGYNILYRASCQSGSVANWVGVQAECDSEDSLHCDGVPWAHTPYVGKDLENCSASGTPWGSYGPDGSRAPWRIALDYLLFPKEAMSITMYDDEGRVDDSIFFNAKAYLNRFAAQYFYSAWCDGGTPGDCLGPSEMESPYKLAHAFDPKYHPKYVTCDNVPVESDTWWAQAMSYPTFTAFVAPYDNFGFKASSNWMDTFSKICRFDNSSGKVTVTGTLCSNSYFEASQEVICTQIMAGAVPALPAKAGDIVNVFQRMAPPIVSTGRRAAFAAAGFVLLGAALLSGISIGRRRQWFPAGGRDQRRIALYQRTPPSTGPDGA